MARRIEVELTSARNDGTWTWRAAGARQPRGELDGSLLYAGAKVGDVVRADADFDVDGITVIAVLAPREARIEPERLEIIGPPRAAEPLVTSDVRTAARGEKGSPRRADRRPGKGRAQDGRGGTEGDARGHRGKRPAKRREPGQDHRLERAQRATPPEPEPKPKARRLRPGRAHRSAVLAELPVEHRPIAEQVLRGGIPAVRQALDKQNEQNRAEGLPEVAPEPLVALAEELLPALRTAEWQDRAEAAVAQVDDVDLRDLRSVVVAADAAARDEPSRALAEQLRAALTQRLEREQAAWLTEVVATLADGRIVRALRLSSRPPKAGAPFPADLAARLTQATEAALTADTSPDRFATLLDALAYSPVRLNVKATSVPAEPTSELKGAVDKLASRLPQIAAQFAEHK